MLSPEDKRLLLKEIALIIKEIRGAGPNCHSINEIGNEVHLLVTGTLSPIEKHLVKNYGQEYIDAIYKFYYDTLVKSVNRVNNLFEKRYNFELVEWRPNFFEDRILFIVKYTGNENLSRFGSK